MFMRGNKMLWNRIKQQTVYKRVTMCQHIKIQGRVLVAVGTDFKITKLNASRRNTSLIVCQ